MQSSGKIAEISCIPPVRVEPIPPLDDMASRLKIYCRRKVLMKNGLIDHEKSDLEVLYRLDLVPFIVTMSIIVSGCYFLLRLTYHKQDASELW